MNKLTLRILASFYIWFMYTRFKTSLSIHHPLESLMTSGKLSNWLSHPIHSGKYESKICPFGHLVGWLLPIVIILYSITEQGTCFRQNDHYQKILRKLYKILWIAIFVVSAILNLNAWLYLVPVFVLEFHLTKVN